MIPHFNFCLSFLIDMKLKISYNIVVFLNSGSFESHKFPCFSCGKPYRTCQWRGLELLITSHFGTTVVKFPSRSKMGGISGDQQPKHSKKFPQASWPCISFFFFFFKGKEPYSQKTSCMPDTVLSTFKDVMLLTFEVNLRNTIFILQKLDNFFRAMSSSLKPCLFCAYHTSLQGEACLI